MLIGPRADLWINGQLWITFAPGPRAPIQLPGGPGQDALPLTLAGRLKPTHGTVTVFDDAQPRAIRQDRLWNLDRLIPVIKI